MDVDDLLSAKQVAAELGLSQPNSVYVYRRRHPDFPEPIIRHGRCYMWHRGDIQRWMRRRASK